MELDDAKLLLIEDDDVDAMAVERGLRKAKIANQLIRAKDGIDAFELLRGSKNGSPILEPFIILLDLNMPRMDGFGFLDELRKDPAYHQTVVFVLTTSKEDQDRARAYDSHVAGYIVKSEAGKDFLDLITMIDHYWRIVKLPKPAMAPPGSPAVG